MRTPRRLLSSQLLVLCLGVFVLAGGVDTSVFAAETGVPTTTAKAPAKRRAPAKKRTIVRKRTSPSRYSAAKARARRLTLARARAKLIRDLNASVEPRLKRDAFGDLVPDVRAEAAIVYNPVTHEVLWESNSKDQRSIASITKVMTAIVFLEDEPDLNRDVTVERADVLNASTTYLTANERIRVEDVLHLMLIASDNAAARMLARLAPEKGVSFIQRMNDKAIEFGLQSTSFADPSGLDDQNVSSAYDISRLIAYAAGDDRISSIMRKTDYSFATSRRRAVQIRSTNKLLGGDVDIRGGKTGFIRKAGYCLATLMKLPKGEQVAVVVLGARSSAGRFLETKQLFKWLSGKAETWFVRNDPATVIVRE